MQRAIHLILEKSWISQRTRKNKIRWRFKGNKKVLNFRFQPPPPPFSWANAYNKIGKIKAKRIRSAISHCVCKSWMHLKTKAIEDCSGHLKNTRYVRFWLKLSKPIITQIYYLKNKYTDKKSKFLSINIHFTWWMSGKQFHRNETINLFVRKSNKKHGLPTHGWQWDIVMTAMLQTRSIEKEIIYACI